MLVESQLDKSKIKSSFGQAAISYDAVADLQREVGQNLLTHITERHLAGCVLDIGCGTGFLSQKVIDMTSIEQLVALDIALPMLHATLQKIDSEKLATLCADAECLPLAGHSVNHIVSNLALQWCENLPAVFSEFKRVLKPGGQLLFSTFAEQTLQELKNAWAKVDSYSHVNHFYNAVEMTDVLERSGFKHIQVYSRSYLSHYESVFALMYELKAIGAHNVTNKRRKTMTGKDKMRSMTNEYEKLRCNGLIPATFQIVTVIAQV